MRIGRYTPDMIYDIPFNITTPPNTTNRDSPLTSPSMSEALPGVLGNNRTWLIETGKQCQNNLGKMGA